MTNFNPGSIMKKISRFIMPVLALGALASCEKIQNPEENQADQKTVTYSISFSASELQTKVIYNDNIKDPVNTDGDNSFTMDWKDGDEVVAIRWPRTLNTAPTDWFTLVAQRDGETAKILFSCDRAHFPASNPLQQGERFVLVHGDFVLGDKNDKASLSFPIARFDFPYSPIHHGGVRKGDNISFYGQSGSLDCLSRHEFMVSDAYVNIIQDDPNYADPSVVGLVQLTKEPVEEGYNSEDVLKLNSVNTIIRLQAFVPEEYFTGEKDGETIQAISISAADYSKTFYRYFRMHPNQQESDDAVCKNYWATDSNTDSECNPYLRINLDDDFNPLNGNTDQSELISKPFTNSSGVVGRLVTAYFAVTSKPVAESVSGEPKELQICIFTTSHAYKTKKKYKLTTEAMKPGNVIPMTINFSPDNVYDILADTDHLLGVTFAPGFVHAEKVNGEWEYGIYEHQGQYAGMSKQSLDFGEYFVFGSADPTECYHKEMVNGVTREILGANYYNSPDKQDVAHKVSMSGTNPFTMPTKVEMDRIFERVMEEGKYCIGYYYYPVSGTSDRTYHLSANAATTMKNVGIPDDGQLYAGSYGIWIGTSTQPEYSMQDRYLFLPDSKQFDNVAAGASVGFEKKDSNGNLYPGGYTLAANGYLYSPGSGWENEESILKFSMNTCDEAPQNGQCYRAQFWYKKNTGWMTDRTNILNMATNYGRPVRSVIF